MGSAPPRQRPCSAGRARQPGGLWRQQHRAAWLPGRPAHPPLLHPRQQAPSPPLSSRNYMPCMKTPRVSISSHRGTVPPLRASKSFLTEETWNRAGAEPLVSSGEISHLPHHCAPMQQPHLCKGVEPVESFALTLAPFASSSFSMLPVLSLLACMLFMGVIPHMHRLFLHDVAGRVMEHAKGMLGRRRTA